MQKILLFLLLLAAIYYWRKLLVSDKKKTRPTESSSPTQQPASRIETMLPCAHCGVLVPQSEGTTVASHFYCSQEHARLGPASHS
ncbi:PP0621 family protein [Uliginosibacterium sp. sgz301328]|uniref:PP0621 family protein n=1 Tax=Uliginosibacterium sp. sgz301328 TaxID=3243764 RepID=UPI00359EF723